MERDGRTYLDTYHGTLPLGAVACTRKDIGGVSSEIFYTWATQFVKLVAPLTCGNRKVLLVYVYYRSHISLRMLELFYVNKFSVYALPVHN